MLYVLISISIYLQQVESLVQNLAHQELNAKRKKNLDISSR